MIPISGANMVMTRKASCSDLIFEILCLNGFFQQFNYSPPFSLTPVKYDVDVMKNLATVVSDHIASEFTRASGVFGKIDEGSVGFRSVMWDNLLSTLAPLSKAPEWSRENEWRICKEILPLEAHKIFFSEVTQKKHFAISFPLPDRWCQGRLPIDRITIGPNIDATGVMAKVSHALAERGYPTDQVEVARSLLPELDCQRVLSEPLSRST